MEDVWPKRFRNLRVTGWLALAALPFALLALLTSDLLRSVTAGIAIFLFLPLLLYIYVLIIWHWKDRYHGKHSDLWGALILIETSGWFKLVYIFRHLLPDYWGTGRYQTIPVPSDTRTAPAPLPITTTPEGETTQ